MAFAKLALISWSVNSGQKLSVQCSLSNWTGLFLLFFFSLCDNLFELAVVLCELAVVLCEVAVVLCEVAVVLCELAVVLCELAVDSGIRYEKAYYL